ncbi:trehalose-phosphatase [Pararhodobacter marinus]|uniref:Trehalose 6-phosphate phosphatase n=1 Tax=Pararhodobacter marinus TaxID=2184063 RepID=A0A2U2CIN0_9RHOB|nr:trehalose-phosphatase [Pararhodobacter marinus]PWE31722.1 trehalose-phosphatase [Pararhodobacter marinus]
MPNTLHALRGPGRHAPPDPARHAFFLDFDGTLVDIAARPSEVVLLPETVDLLKALQRASDGAVAILSGRALAELERLTAQVAPVLAGTHGVEIRRDAGTLTPSFADRRALDTAYRVLDDLARSHGLLLETKPGALALHYRNRPDLAPLCKNAVSEVARKSNLRMIAGNMVCEAMLTGYDKGRALQTLMGEAPFRDRIPVMVGDDTTDEDGFLAAQQLGGIGVSIGRRDSCARLFCPDRYSAMDWLRAGVERSV